MNKSVFNFEIYNDKLDSLKEIAIKYQMPDTFLQEIEELRTQLKNYSVKIVLTGIFSSGKTAFINALIGKYILSEDIAPETAIASEIYYSPAEYFIAIQGKSYSEKHQLSELASVNVEQTDYLKIYINSPFIRTLEKQGWTLVDMPGLNSNIASHKNSILHYASSDALSLITVPVDEGSLTAPIISFIEEVNNYQHDIALAITKCDLRPDSITDVASEVKEQIEFYTDRDCPCICISNREDPSTLQEKLTQLLQKLDQKELFKQFFEKRFSPLLLKMTETLQIYRNGLHLNEEELQNAIDSSSLQLEQAKRHMEQTRRNVKMQFNNTQKEQIMMTIEQTLEDHAEQIARYASSNPEAANRYVNQLLRPVLYQEINSLAEINISAFTASDNFFETNENNACDSENEYGSEFQEAGTTVVELTHNLQDTLHNLPILSNGSMVPAYDYEGQIPKNPNTLATGASVLQGIVGTLAIATDFVAPWVEVIAFLLPTVLKLFATSSNNQKDEAENKVRQEVIPAIVQRLREKLEIDIFPQLLEAIETKALQEETQSIARIERALTKAQNEQHTKIEEHQKNMDSLQHDMNALTKLADLSYEEALHDKE